ncbi:MAG: nuclear transport factor 2 family protein [Verrucomicrobiaceae bacterium]|nr:MAG: nuclear transport factor 2 family protein [Verrucomicrobiaceae bacterium]
MTSSPLPPPILPYIEAVNAADIDKASACFAPEAVVHDEGRDHAGAPAIRSWLEETGRKYAPQLAATGAVERDGQVLAPVTVSGNFPGSPADLTFAFTLAGGKITALHIS